MQHTTKKLELTPKKAESSQYRQMNTRDNVHLDEHIKISLTGMLTAISSSQYTLKRLIEDEALLHCLPNSNPAVSIAKISSISEALQQRLTLVVDLLQSPLPSNRNKALALLGDEARYIGI